MEILILGLKISGFMREKLLESFKFWKFIFNLVATFIHYYLYRDFNINLVAGYRCYIISTRTN